MDEGLIREKIVVARSPRLCENENPKQFLSAYTPQGAYKLNAVDQKYLESLQFPLAQVEEGDLDPSWALETTHGAKGSFLAI